MVDTYRSLHLGTRQAMTEGLKVPSKRFDISTYLASDKKVAEGYYYFLQYIYVTLTSRKLYCLFHYTLRSSAPPCKVAHREPVLNRWTCTRVEATRVTSEGGIIQTWIARKGICKI